MLQIGKRFSRQRDAIFQCVFSRRLISGSQLESLRLTELSKHGDAPKGKRLTLLIVEPVRASLLFLRIRAVR